MLFHSVRRNNEPISQTTFFVISGGFSSNFKRSLKQIANTDQLGLLLLENGLALECTVHIYAT